MEHHCWLPLVQESPWPAKEQTFSEWGTKKKLYHQTLDNCGMSEHRVTCLVSPLQHHGDKWAFVEHVSFFLKSTFRCDDLHPRNVWGEPLWGESLQGDPCVLCKYLIPTLASRLGTYLKHLHLCITDVGPDRSAGHTPWSTQSPPPFTGEVTANRECFRDVNKVSAGCGESSSIWVLTNAKGGKE